MTAQPGAGTTPAGPSSGGPWYPPAPSLAALPVDSSKTTPKPAYYKLQFGDDYTGFSYYVRTLNVVIGRNCERAVPPPEQLEQGVPTDPPLRGDDGLPPGSGVGGSIEEIFGPSGSWAAGGSSEDIKPTDGLDLSILGDDILDQFASQQDLHSSIVQPQQSTTQLLDVPPNEDIKPEIPSSPPRAHTTPPESHPHTHLNGNSPLNQHPSSAPPSANLALEPESYFDPLFAPPAPPPPPKKNNGPVDHVDVDLGPLKSVSRNHARIEYNNDLGHFCLEILGRNGAWVDDRYFVKGSIVPLNQGSQIQIATRIFSFILPPSADPSPYSPFGHEDTANALEDVPYPYNLPPGEVGYAEFYGEPGPGPSSTANMGGRIPAAFNVFAGTDGLAMGIEGAEGKVWDDEWDNSDEEEDDSDEDDDDSDEEDDDDEEEAEDQEEETSRTQIPKVRIRLKAEGGTATPDKGSVDGDGDSEMSAEDKKKGNNKATLKEPQASPQQDPKPAVGKAGKTTSKAAKKKAATAKAEETAESGMDVDPPASAPPAETPTAPKPKKENPPKKKQSKKKKVEPAPVDMKPNNDEMDVTEPMVATLAAALAENPAPPPPPQIKPPVPIAPSTATPNQTPAKPAIVQNGIKPSATPNAAAGAPGATNPQIRPMPPKPGQPVQQAQPGQPGQAARPPVGAPQVRPPPGVVHPQAQKAMVNASPAPSPTRQNSVSSAPPEPPKPFFLTELIETPGQPGHIVVNVPIPPSGAGPRPPPGPLIGLDGKPFIGPPPIKPTATFATIIHRALLNLPRGRGTLGEVCNWVAGEWEWFRLNIDAGWQNSIRHNLSLNKAFLKVPRIPEDDPESKGSVWIIDPEEGPLFEEKQRRDAMKSAGKEKNAEVRRERERQKVEERARKQREMAMEAHAAHGPHAAAHPMASQAKPVLPRPAPIPPRPVQRAQAPSAVSANAKGLLQPKAKIQVSIQTLTPAHRAKSVIATTDSSGNPLPFACDGTTLTLDQATFGHLTGDIIDKLTLLGAAGAVDVLSAWVINKNKNQAARAAQQAAAAQASSKPTAASIKAGLTAPRNGATPAPSTAAAQAKPVVKKPIPAATPGQKFGPAPPGATLTKVIGMIAEVANAKGDVNTVGPNAGALLRYIRVVGVDLDLRVAERIWVTGVVPPVLAKKGGPGAKPNGTAAGTPKPAPGPATVRPAGTAPAQTPAKAPVQPVVGVKVAAPPVRPPATGQTAPSAGGPLGPSLAAGGNAAPKPPVGGAPNALATGGAGVKRKLEEGGESDEAKKPKVETAS